MDFRKQQYASLTREQLDFMRANVDTMTQRDLGKKFGCSAGKVCENARLAGIVFPDRNANKPVKPSKQSEFFDAAQFKSWY